MEGIKRKLLVKYAPFGSVLANVTFQEAKSINTAATDGKVIYYNPDFVASLTEQETTFLFAHEVCHIAFDHIYRSEGKDEEVWNVATDAVINAMLKEDKLPLIKGGVDRKEGKYLSAEELYEKLLKEKEQEQQQAQNDSQNQPGKNNGEQGENHQSSSSSKGESQSDDQTKSQNSGQESSLKEQEAKNQDVGHDTHALWKKAVEKRQEEQKETGRQETNGKDDNSKEKPEAINEQNVFQQIKIERKKQLEELRKSLAKESHTHGTTSNGDVRAINDIGMAKPLVEWRRVLKEAIKFDVDWTYQNASIEDGVVTPYLEELPKPETEIVLDTSGSIDENLLRNFLRECKNILENSKVKVGCFDTQFYGFTEIRSVEDIDTLTFQGGGGTNFNAAVSAFTRRVENKIIFTDGEAPMPSTPLDAIWVVFGGEKINPQGGKVIQIDEEALKTLSYTDHTSNGPSRRR